MSSIFRINLSFRLNFYVFQFVHAAKNTEKMLIINEMITTLIIEEKRTDYEKNNKNVKTRSVKNKKKIFLTINQSIKKNLNHATTAKIYFITKNSVIIFISN